MLLNQANLPYWIFLAMGVLLFIFIIISGRQNIDVDVDGDVDFDADSDSELGIGELLGWAGIGKAPLILLLAIDLSFWGIFGLTLNIWFGSSLGGLISGIVLICSLILSLFIGRLIAEPISRLFAEFGEDVSSERLIGCIGIVNTFYIPRENQGKIGQVDVVDAKRNLLTISAVLAEWATIAPQRGERVLIIELKEQIYVVITKDSADEEYWLTNSQPKN
ncbi:MAG: DUF1449 family protein [Nostoc sp. TH1S01]|nr:DUF1449 family protein [Nostoc sp. TH1S01]